MSNNDGLTEKQKMFAREYIIDLNGKQAAIRAGYAETNAKFQASRLLTYANLQAYLSKLMDERSKKLEIKAEKVLNEIAKIAFGNISNLFNKDGDLIPIHELPNDVAATLRFFIKNNDSYTYKTYDKTSALELLGKHLKLFTDKFDVNDGLPTVEIITKRFDGSTGEEDDE